MRDSSHRLVSREFIVATEQVRSFRGRAVSEPWPIPPVRTSLEMEARLLDSNVQELLGTEDLGAYGLTSDMQLQ